MGCTLEELGQRMSAQEFGLHLALDEREPLTPGMQVVLSTTLAAIANGALKTPPGRLYNAGDFMRDPWEPPAPPAPPPDDPKTVDEIMLRVRAIGG